MPNTFRETPMSVANARVGSGLATPLSQRIESRSYALDTTFHTPQLIGYIKTNNRGRQSCQWTPINSRSTSNESCTPNITKIESLFLVTSIMAQPTILSRRFVDRSTQEISKNILLIFLKPACFV